MPEQKKHVLELLSLPRPWMLSSLARECGTTEKEAALQMPEDMCVLVPGTSFEKIWSEVSHWEKAAFIIQHKGHVIEVQGRIREGSSGHGYYNIGGDEGLSGHIKADAITDIAFLSMPFMGKESHSIQFFGEDGSVSFAIYLGRADHEIIPSVKASFMKMKAGAARN